MKMIIKVKYIDIKNRTYYFFNDIINIKKFDPNNITIDKKSNKWICDDERFGMWELIM